MSDATDYDALLQKLGAAGLTMPGQSAPAPAPAPAPMGPPAQLDPLTQALMAKGLQAPSVGPSSSIQPMIGPPAPPPQTPIAPVRKPVTLADVNASNMSVARGNDMARVSEINSRGLGSNGSRPTPLEIDRRNARADMNVDLSGMPSRTAVGRAETEQSEAIFAPRPVAPTTIPAHEQALISPERQAAIRAADQGIIDATADQARAGMHEAEAATIGHMQRGALLDEQKKDIREKADVRDAATQRQIDTLNQLSADAASQKIDPEHWYKSRSTGEKIGYSIAAALGGFVSGFKGGPNQAMDAMFRHADEDIAAQKQEIQSKRDRIGDMRGVLAETYRRFGNMEQAESAARILSLQQMDAQIAEYAAGSKSETIQANANLAAAQVRKATEEEGAKWNKWIPTQQSGGTAGVSWKDQAAIGKELEKAQLPAAEQALANIHDIIARNKGEIPGTSYPARIVKGVAGNHSSLLSTDARQLDGAVTTVAEAIAHANGQRGVEAIQLNKDTIFGNGSAEDIKAGLARAQKILHARKANIVAGHDPGQVEAHRQLQGAYGGGSGGSSAPVRKTPITDDDEADDE